MSSPATHQLVLCVLGPATYNQLQRVPCGKWAGVCEYNTLAAAGAAPKRRVAGCAQCSTENAVDSTSNPQPCLDLLCGGEGGGQMAQNQTRPSRCTRHRQQGSASRPKDQAQSGKRLTGARHQPVGSRPPSCICFLPVRVWGVVARRDAPRDVERRHHVAALVRGAGPQHEV